MNCAAAAITRQPKQERQANTSAHYPIGSPGLIEKKIVPRNGKFPRQKNMVSKHHVYHAIDHNFTTKTPRSAHRFFPKTPEKTRSYRD
jgi:hypothetical protein